MIDINKTLASFPSYRAFRSLADINAFTLALRGDPRFKVSVAGRSALGKPIRHVRFGRGGIKVLVVGYPHPNEPVGGLTVLALLTLLKEKHSPLAGQGIEWHIVPCAAPDGAALTEGWTLRPFSFRRFMEYYFRKDPCHDIESSFPIKYGTLDFHSPVPETRALMRVMRSARPDLYYSLHNASSEKAFFFVGRDLARKHCARLHALAKRLRIPLSEEPLPMAVKTYAKSIFSEILIRAEYDSIRKSGDDPAKYIKSGATPVEYLREYNKEAFSFLCEFPHVKRTRAAKKTSGPNRRRMLLRSEADRLYFISVLLGEWRKVGKEVNKSSPFYSQVAARMPGRETALKNPRLQAKLLSDPAADRPTLPAEAEESRLETYYDLCWNWQFLRLLEDSRRTPAVKAASARLKTLLTGFYLELEKTGAFAGFKPIPVNNLVRAQLGCGLIVINSILEERLR